CRLVGLLTTRAHRLLARGAHVEVHLGLLIGAHRVELGDDDPDEAGLLPELAQARLARRLPLLDTAAREHRVLPAVLPSADHQDVPVLDDDRRAADPHRVTAARSSAAGWSRS